MSASLAVLAGCSGGSGSASGCAPLAVVDGLTDLRQYDLLRVDASGKTELLTDDRRSLDPSVSPDGSWVAFTRAAPGSHEECCGYSDTHLRIMKANEANSTAVPRVDGWNDSKAAISADGASIAFLRSSPDTRVVKLMLADKAGRGQRELIEVETHANAPAWSPNGEVIALTTVEDGGAPIYRLLLVNVDDGTIRDATSGDLAGEPAWSPDGERIVLSAGGYESGDPIRELDVATGEVRVIGTPPDASWTNASYAHSGERFRVLRFEQSIEPEPQRLETIGPDGTVVRSLQLEQRRMSTGDGRVLLGNLSQSACFSPQS